MTDFNENYALLCAMVDAVIALQVQVIIEDVFQKLVFFFLILNWYKYFFSEWNFMDMASDTWNFFPSGKFGQR